MPYVNLMDILLVTGQVIFFKTVAYSGLLVVAAQTQ